MAQAGLRLRGALLPQPLPSPSAVHSRLTLCTGFLEPRSEGDTLHHEGLGGAHLALPGPLISSGSKYLEAVALTGKCDLLQKLIFTSELAHYPRPPIPPDASRKCHRPPPSSSKKNSCRILCGPSCVPEKATPPLRTQLRGQWGEGRPQGSIPS